MNVWHVAILLLLPPFAIPLAVAMRADADSRLAAVQVAGTLAALILALMTFAFDQPSFIDLALGLTLLSVPGTFLVTIFLERWL